MTKFRSILSTLSSVVVVGLTAFAGFWLFKEAWHALLGVPKDWIGPLFTGAVAVAVTLYSKYVDRSREIEARLREKKAEIYEPFLKGFFAMMSAGRAETDIQTDEIHKDFAAAIVEFQPKVILWGSSDMIKTYGTIMRQGVSNPENSLINTACLLKAIRTDLGHPNKDLEDADVLQVFINEDVRLYLRQMKDAKVADSIE